MDTCPHCGSPGAFADATDGRCPVCGMALPLESEAADFDVEATEAPQRPEPDASTLRPAQLAPGETATIAPPGEPPDQDDEHDLPQGADLIRPRKLSPEYERRVTAAWQQTHPKFKNLQETIKSEKSGVSEFGELRIGSRIVGRVEDAGVKDYDLTEVIGEGAMGTVWSARQASLNRAVAIKIPKEVAATTEMGRRQFMSEVVVTGQLDHPNIVPVYDLGKDASGQLFCSMKRIEGRPWNELLEQQELSQQENLETLLKVCDAIRFAHDRGVIHRDIKPHNVMVGEYGEVSVMDWGIAIRLDSDRPDSTIAKISPAGTPAYMAPEMATGSAGEIGPATDVYLLGAVLYEILTGEPPHPPPTESQQRNQMLTDALLIAARNEITSIDNGELGDIAYRALATDTANRYQSVDDFQDAIREYLSHVESVNLTERGEALLERAKVNERVNDGRQGGRFDDFDRARFAFDEALQIWPANRVAGARLAETLLEYANYAYDEGAYARGIALLSDENPEHKGLLRKLRSARRRTRRLSLLLKAAVLLIIVGGSVFSLFLYRARNEAIGASNDAIYAQKLEEEAKNDAVDAQKAEEKAKDDAIDARNLAVDAQKAEEEAKNDAIDARNLAVDAQKAEENAKNDAIDARNDAVEAQQEAQRSSYAFEIGLAAEELQRNAFNRVDEIISSQAESETKRSLRSWEWGYLKALVSRDTRTVDLQGRVEAIAISENRKWVVAGTSSGDVYVWPFDRSADPIRLRYGDAVNAVAITPDGASLLAAGRIRGGRHAVKLWTLEADGVVKIRDEAAPIRELGSHAAPILSIDLARDASQVLTGAADGTVALSPVDGEGKSKTFQATTQINRIWTARFSPDGKWIVTAGEDGVVRVWNAGVQVGADGAVREAFRFEGREGPIYSATFSPDGQHVVWGGLRGRLRAIPFDPLKAAEATYSPAETARRGLESEAETPQPSLAVLLGQHTAAVRSLVFAPDEPVMFSAGHDHTIRVWDVADGFDGRAELIKTLRGHGGWVRSCVPLPADPKSGATGSLLSGGYDRRVRVWNWRSYAFPLVLRHESRRSLGDLQLTAGAVSPEGEWLAAASASGIITMWDMVDPLKPKPVELTEGHDWQATSGVYFPDGMRLLTAGGDNTTLVWDDQRGIQIQRIGGRNALSGTGWRGVAAVSGDGRWIATGAGRNDEQQLPEERVDGEMLAHIWNAETAARIASIPTPDRAAWPEGEKPEATAMAFAPDGQMLAIGDQWGTCYLASPGKKWQVQSFQAHQSKISAIEFLTDGGGFLTASSDGTVQQWALGSDGASPRSTFRHADRVVAMDLSGDGTTIITAAGSDDEQAVLRIWDRSRPDAPIYSLRLSEIDGAPATPDERKSMVRSVALHPQKPVALVTIFDPRDPTYRYRVGRWAWTDEARPYRLVPTGGLRDVSTALFAAHRGDAFLTVGGRGARLREFAASETPVSMTYRPQSGIRSLSFSPDGMKLLSASDDGSVKVWTLDREARRWTPELKLVGRHAAAINSVAFHPSRDDQFLTASDDGTAKLWRLSDGAWELARTMSAPDGQTGPMLDAVFLRGPDDDLRIVAAGAGGAYLWEGTDAAPRAIGQNGSICCLVPSPDGQSIAVARGSSVTMHDATTLQPTVTLSGHSAEVTSVAFTPDGSRLFTASRDYTVKLWNTEKAVLADPNGANQQRELLTLEGHFDEVTSVTVVARPEQPFVVTTGLDGQAIIWPNEPPEP